MASELHHRKGSASMPPESAYSGSAAEVLPDAGDERRLDEVKRATGEAWQMFKSEMPQGGMGWLEAFLPCIRWLRGYKWREWFIADFLAGIAATIMTVPENISNAGLAGAPAVFGLYASILPSLAYAIWGSCGQMAVGAVAISMITLGDGLINVFGELQDNPNNPADPEMQDQINRAIIQVSLLSGAMLFGLGFFRLGFLTNLMSYAVVAGYLAGAALLIIVSQLKFFFGLEVEHASTVQGVIEQVAINIDQFNWRDLVMGLSFTITLIVCKEIGIKNHKFWWLKAVGTLFCLIVGILVMNLAHLYEPKDDPLVDPLGSVPKGFPKWTVSWWGPITTPSFEFMTAVVTTMLVMLIETICMARKLSAEHGVQLDANAELRAIGICNFFAAAFCTTPTAGSISRAAVVNSANGKTPMSSFVTFIAVLIITIWFTGIFTNMPDNLAGAIMVSAVYRVLNPYEAWYCLKVSFFDFLLYLTTFCIVSFCGVYYGMFAGIVLALLVHMHRTVNAPTSVLGRLPGTNSYRDTKLFPEAEEEAGVLLLKVEAGLFFANVPPLRNWVYQEVAKAQERCAMRGEELSFLVLDICATHHVDADTVQFLKGLIEEMAKRDIRVVLVNQSVVVLKALRSRALDDAPVAGTYQHHFGSLKSSLHVDARRAAAAAAAAGADADASEAAGQGRPASLARVPTGIPSEYLTPRPVYHDAGEMFSDTGSALAHCTSMVRTLGLSRKHRLECVVEEAEDEGQEGGAGDAAQDASDKLKGEHQV